MTAAANQWSGTANGTTGHACNCIGCCDRCGTCRTNPIHSPLYCARLQSWHRDRPRPDEARAT